MSREKRGGMDDYVVEIREGVIEVRVGDGTGYSDASNHLICDMRNTAFAISRRFVAIELVCVAPEQLGLFSLVSYLYTRTQEVMLVWSFQTQ